MAGTAPQAAGRRARGAAGLPRPAAEQRRALEAAAPAASMGGVAPLPQLAPAPPPHHPHTQRSSKHVLPRLHGSTVSASPRDTQTRDDAGQQQQHVKAVLLQQLPGAGISSGGSHRVKQLPLGDHLTSAAGDVQPPDTIRAKHAREWPGSVVAPPLLPSDSPDGLPEVPPLATTAEDDDAVLIGSTAPSFTQPAPLLSARHPHLAALGVAGAVPPAASGHVNSGSAAQSAASPPRSRRTSHLGLPQLGAEDMSLSALAAASHRCTRSSSPGNSASPRRAFGCGSFMAEAGPEIGASGHAHSRQAQQQEGRRPAEQLSSGELALLRQSLLELRLDPGGGGAGEAAAAGGAEAPADEIPDTMVLQELSSRLGRLDSQKRRVLLAVLAKIDGMARLDGGAATSMSDAEEPAEGLASGAAGAVDAAASQLIAGSLSSSRRTSAAGAVHGASGSTQTQPSSGHPVGTEAQRPQAQHVRLPEQQQQQQQQVALPASPPPEQVPSSKTIAEKLATLQLGRSNSPSGKPSGASVSDEGTNAPLPADAHAPAAAKVPVPQPHQAHPYLPAASSGHPHGSSRLQPMVQQRHRERSRLSGDGVRSTRGAMKRPSHLSGPAASAVSLANSSGGDALSAFAAEHENASPAQVTQLHCSADVGAGASVGDSLELLAPLSLLAQPSQLDVVTAGASSPSPPPLSACGQLANAPSLPLPQPARSPLSLPHPARSPLHLPQQASSPVVQQPLPQAASKAAPDAVPVAPAAAGAAPTMLEQRGCVASAALTSSSRGSTPGSGTSNAAVLHCQELTLVLLDTWGDSHFMGLAGLQLLGADGQPLLLTPDQLVADPANLNVFPGHSGDVRTVDKLVDGTNNTVDDTHMWLAPVKRQLSATAAATASQQHAKRWAALPEGVLPYNLLSVRLPAGGVWVSGLRIWNYNKSAHDTARGVKRMLVLADGVEVSPPGGVLLRRALGIAAFPFGQLIPLNTCWAAAACGARVPGSSAVRREAQRRSTQQAGPRQGAAAPAAGQQQGQAQPVLVHSESVAWLCNLPDPPTALEYLHQAAALARASGPGASLVGQPGENFATLLPCGFTLRLVLLSSWGCPHYLGLSGLEVRDAVRGPLRIRGDQVFAVPGSVAQLPGMSADVRTPDKLLDGNNSGSPQHSWLAPLDAQRGNEVHIMLDAPLLLGALRVWNYARTPSRGVQQLEVYLDEHLVFKVGPSGGGCFSGGAAGGDGLRLSWGFDGRGWKCLPASWEEMGVLQRAPAELSPGQDFSQTLCFSEEAMAEASATTRRRAAATARGGRPSLRPRDGGSLPGDALGVEGVEEWCHAQERVVLVNDGEYVAFPPDSAAGPATARPVTSVVAAA